MSPRGSTAAAVRLGTSTRRYEERPLAAGLYRKRNTPSGIPPIVCFTVISRAISVPRGSPGAGVATFWNRGVWSYGPDGRAGVLRGAVLTRSLISRQSALVCRDQYPVGTVASSSTG